MNSIEFDILLNKRLEATRKVLGFKGDEYASTDRLYNFKRAAEIGKMDPVEALKGMMLKHIVSVFDLMEGKLKNNEHYRSEKIGDTINYLLLLEALLKEKEDDQKPVLFKHIWDGKPVDEPCEHREDVPVIKRMHKLENGEEVDLDDGWVVDWKMNTDGSMVPEGLTGNEEVEICFYNGKALGWNGNFVIEGTASSWSWRTQEDDKRDKVLAWRIVDGSK